MFLNYIVRFRYSFCYQLVCLHGVGIRVRQRCIDHFFQTVLQVNLSYNDKNLVHISQTR